MKWIITLMLTSTAFGAHAQHGAGSMFTEAGQLRADTTLVISPDQLRRWLAVEDLLLSHVVKNVRYSDMAMASQVNGRMVCSFEVENIGGIGDFRLISGPGYGMDQVLKRVLGSFKLIGSLSDGESSSGVYFIALDLQLVDPKSHLKEHGVIPIIGVDTNVIQY